MRRGSPISREISRSRSGVESLIELQRSILDDTAAWLGADGLLVYSTCSVWPEENELQIKQLLDRNPALALLAQHSIYPSFDTTDPQAYHDGGYIAVLQKKPAG